MKLHLTSSLTSAIETIIIAGDALTTEIDLEDLNAYIREFANDHGVTESSVSYEVLPGTLKKFSLTLCDAQGSALCLGYDETVEAETAAEAIRNHEDYLTQCDVYRTDSVPENMKGYASEYDHIEAVEI
jgi:hypothetical protein